MRWRRTSVIACLAAGAFAPACAGTGEAARCRSGQVEWIVGGSGAAVDCPTGSRASGAAPAVRHRVRAAAVPSVSPERDRDRDRILRDELAQEEATLARQLRDGAEARDPAGVQRTRANIAALQKEMARP